MCTTVKPRLRDHRQTVSRDNVAAVRVINRNRIPSPVDCLLISSGKPVDNNVDNSKFPDGAINTAIAGKTPNAERGVSMSRSGRDRA